jgi:hypothetical protein
MELLELIRGQSYSKLLPEVYGELHDSGLLFVESQLCDDAPPARRR